MNYAKWKQYQNYVIIGVISLVSLFFLPMLGAQIGIGWVLPTTVAGWAVYVISKLLVATINILIFHCFVSQGKINILTHPNYIAANEILGDIAAEEAEKARSPRQFLGAVYGKKGVTIFLTSALSAVGLTQAILTFDVVSMLTYLFTIILGIVFGLLQMAATEIYWTEEYLRYAKDRKREEEERAKNTAEMVLAPCEETPKRDDNADIVRGTFVLESPNSSCASCPTN